MQTAQVIIMKIRAIIIFILLFFLFESYEQQIHAPELVRGTMTSVDVGQYRIGFVDGGDRLVLMVGTRKGIFEDGFLYTKGEIPLPYSIQWRNEAKLKFRGTYKFRDGDRKICGADTIDHLPCH